MMRRSLLTRVRNLLPSRTKGPGGAQSRRSLEAKFSVVASPDRPNIRDGPFSFLLINRPESALGRGGLPPPNSGVPSGRTANCKNVRPRVSATRRPRFRRESLPKLITLVPPSLYTQAPGVPSSRNPAVNPPGTCWPEEKARIAFFPGDARRSCPVLPLLVVERYVGNAVAENRGENSVSPVAVQEVDVGLPPPAIEPETHPIPRLHSPCTGPGDPSCCRRRLTVVLPLFRRRRTGRTPRPGSRTSALASCLRRP